MQRYLSLQKCVSFRLVQLHVANRLSLSILCREHGVGQGSVLSIEPLQNWFFLFDSSPESYVKRKQGDIFYSNALYRVYLFLKLVHLVSDVIPLDYKGVRAFAQILQECIAVLFGEFDIVNKR